MGTDLNISEIRKQLKKQKQTLTERVENDQEESNRNNNPDRSDLAMRYIQNQRDGLLQARAAEHIKEIDAALNRIDNETFGQCVNCGGSIHPDRLTAIPTTALCMKCKAEN